ncbi:AAA family ATPase [Ferrovum sp.]|uniref:ATP-dependent nuclease n=1 Tax=Ferrovum sp. TaxID=2609467 RepID=UPI0026226A86|nr:AAA family ATPase [Ferrovum sp.]
MSSQGKLTLRNFRCFDWKNPAVLEFGDGFTAFVGSNNSGKSTALRAVYELRSMLPYICSTLRSDNTFRMNCEPNGVADRVELANDSDPTKFQFNLEISEEHRPQVGTADLLAIEICMEYDVESQLLTAKSFNAVNHQGGIVTFDEQRIRLAARHPDAFRIEYQDQTVVNFSKLQEFSIDLQQSKYFPAFRNAINKGAGMYYDLPVGTSLVTTWDQWKAGSLRAQKIAISRVENEIASLLDFKTLQINADQTSNTLDVIIDGRPQKLHEVGAGVSQLIIVLAAAIVNKPPYILIDEPELSLHPSLQLNFLATLGSYAQKGLLYSTHSISLARSTAQRIYAVKKIRNGSSQMHPFGDGTINFGGWLGELSYSSRVEIGCEGLLLVEGSTDVLFFQEFLRKIKKDHKYVLMQLGGSSLIRGGVTPHLSELSRIIEPSKIRVFIDSEKDSADAPLATDRVEFVAECKSIGIDVCVSQRRATENYFEHNGIQKALGAEYKPLETFQKLKSSPKPWHKSDNWRIARETEFEDIKDTDLGIFLLAL